MNPVVNNGFPSEEKTESGADGNEGGWKLKLEPGEIGNDAAARRILADNTPAGSRGGNILEDRVGEIAILHHPDIFTASTGGGESAKKSRNEEKMQVDVKVRAPALAYVLKSTYVLTSAER